MVNAVRLASASADLNIVWKASLNLVSQSTHHRKCTSITCDRGTYPHSGMQRAGNLIVLLQPWAASQYLWQPELTNGTLHVTNLSLCWWRGLDPLGRLAANAADHVRMCEGLWCSLLWLRSKRRWNWLSNPRVERRGSAGDVQVVVDLLVASGWSGITVTRPRTSERGVCCERGGHVREYKPVFQNGSEKLMAYTKTAWCLSND